MEEECDQCQVHLRGSLCIYSSAKGQTASHMNRDIEIYFSISHVMSHVFPTMFNVQQVSSTAVLVFFPRFVSSPIFPGMSYRIA